MPTHVLKTDPTVFQKIINGSKNFKIRKNDRGFKVGDTLHLRETRCTGADMYEHNLPLEYTGEEVFVTVDYILYGPVHGLQAGWCIMSISVVPSAHGA